MNVRTTEIDPAGLERLSAHKTLQHALDHYPFTAKEESQLRVRVEQDFCLMGSVVLLKHVFFNLIKNALYAIAKANNGSIEIRIQRRGQLGVIHISDTGNGISHEHLPHIFDDFFSVKPAGTGTGTGLAFCRRVMRSLEGEILCDSEPSSHTTFTLRFPSVDCHGTTPSSSSDST